MGFRIHAHAEDAAPVVAAPAPVTPVVQAPTETKAPETKSATDGKISAPAENSAGAQATTDVKTSASPANASGTEEGEYEIDYEEEPADTDEMEPAEPVKVTREKKTSSTATAANSNGGSGGIQGSRAKHRFNPILKSETKSIYQKDGKALDVDTD